MTDGSLEVVRTAVEALNGRNIDAFVSCLHDDVMWEESSDAFPGLKGRYHGPQAVRDWAVQAVVEYWADVTMEVEELAAIANGGVIVGLRISARGAASGIATETHAWQVVWINEGRVSHRQGPFWARADVLEVASLAE